MFFDDVKLNNLFNIYGAKSARKRVGRGIGCTKGKTCGRGVKGQKARSGVSIRHFEGGQMPLISRLPKRGFNPLKRFAYNVINLYVINYLIEEEFLQPNAVVNHALLVAIGIIKSEREKVKVLGNDPLTAPLTFALDDYSETARQQILSAGGHIN